MATAKRHPNQIFFRMISPAFIPEPSALNYPNPACHQPHIDIPKALSSIGGDEPLLRDLASLFVTESNKQMTLLNNALRQNDYPLAARALHSLKGSLAVFVAKKIHQTIHLFEAALEQDNDEMIDDLHGTLKTQIAAMQQEARSLAATSPETPIPPSSQSDRP